MKIYHYIAVALLFLSGFCTHVIAAEDKLSSLIIDGQNNHNVWPKSTVMMKQYLEQSGLFTVDVYRTKPTWRGEEHPEQYKKHSDESQFHVEVPIADPTFAPTFSNYDVIISNFGNTAAAWPTETEKAFEDYMKNGGGFVSVHAADNAFPKWKEFNKMIGVGGWGDRDETAGPHLYYSDDNRLIIDNTKGAAGTHGDIHELEITKRNDHPILAGLPDQWMHSKDECYGNLRGPAENMTILATANCALEFNDTGKHEPMIMTIDYGKGRIFHTAMGHNDISLSSVGFITIFLRGTEWAATGKVSQDIPIDFPTVRHATTRPFKTP
ncbi:MAG: ThuA domain-containing protein [Kordiimonadaceae bacterium]|jgi:uncharacterized protein|nr:ThuA domain-containing protein [Kordiimonadaceae bacterium]MBT6031780.1 ThuA domain-containing protein [Kordiimonadaceae bacterium]